MDDPSLLTTLLLIAAAFLAGLVDAIVGGGGLIQLPALVIAFPQAAPVHLLATNKLASIFGTTTSTITYLRRVPVDLRTGLPLAGSAYAGSLLGALVATMIPKAAFSPIILAALIGVGTYTILRPRLGEETRLRYAGRRHLLLALVIGVCVGFYDGALGPGTGSFFVIALVALAGYAFLEASAKAKLANAATNLAALTVFIPLGAVQWRIGLAMAAANVLGGYLGARTAVARGSGFVRVVFIVVVAAFTLRIGYDVLTQLRG